MREKEKPFSKPGCELDFPIEQCVAHMVQCSGLPSAALSALRNGGYDAERATFREHSPSEYQKVLQELKVWFESRCPSCCRGNKWIHGRMHSIDSLFPSPLSCVWPPKAFGPGSIC